MPKSESFNLLYRAVERSENPGVPVIFGGHPGTPRDDRPVVVFRASCVGYFGYQSKGCLFETPFSTHLVTYCPLLY